MYPFYYYVIRKNQKGQRISREFLVVARVELGGTRATIQNVLLSGQAGGNAGRDSIRKILWILLKESSDFVQ